MNSSQSIIQFLQHKIKHLNHVSDKLFSLWRILPFIGTELEFYISGNNIIYSVAAIEKKYNIVKEKGNHQYEIIFLPEHNIENVISNIADAKAFIVQCCHQYNNEVIFDAKPYDNDYGSAMQFHISFYQDNENLFIKNKGFLEQMVFSIMTLTDSGGCYFIADQKQDYSRYIPRFMAPTNISWGGNNRTVLVRIPVSDLQNKRIEFRLPSAMADPYKVIYFLLLSALYTKQRQYKYPCIYGNAFDKQYDLKKLPININMAKKTFYNNSLFANILQQYTI